MDQQAWEAYRGRERERGERQRQLVAQLQQLTERTEGRDRPVRPSEMPEGEWAERVCRERDSAVGEARRIKRELQVLHRQRLADLKAIRPSRGDMRRLYAELEQQYGPAPRADLLRRMYADRLSRPGVPAAALDEATRARLVDELVDRHLHPWFSWRRSWTAARMAPGNLLGRVAVTLSWVVIWGMGASLKGVLIRLLLRLPVYALVLGAAHAMGVLWLGVAIIIVSFTGWCFRESDRLRKWRAAS